MSSQLNENLNYKGMLDIVLKDDTGAIKERLTVPNLVVSVGRAYIAARMVSNANTIMSHMAIGDTSTAAALGDTALGNQLARVALSSGTASANVVTYVANFPAGTGTGGVQEAGIFNNSTGGDMLCRTTFSVVNKGASDTLSITWTVSNTSS